MKNILILLFSLLILSQEAALGQNNGNGKGNGNANGNNGNGNGNGKGNNGNGNGNGGVPALPADDILTGGQAASTLPVTLTSFTASAGKNQVILQWATATEKNNAYFQIERSLDGLNFSAIGQVTGHGTTVQVQQYSFKDVNPVNGIQYYRLNQVDLDGGNEFSAVKVVKASAPLVQKLPVYPNPVVADLNIDLNTLPAGTYTISMIPVAGGAVKQQVVQAGELVRFNLQDVPAGAYVLTINGGNFKQTTKFFKS